jgi:hypothetical protein
MANTTKSNTVSIAALMNDLSSIEVERINWEDGSYKTSNDELYAILTRCMTALDDINAMQKGKRTLIKAIDEKLTKRGVPLRKNTSLVAKIVRLIFGDCGKRAFTYARVILVAAAEKPENQTLAAFITERGGIEEIRKSNGGLTAKDKREDLAEAGEARLDEALPIVGGIVLVDELQPDNDNGMEMMAVLMRKEDDGTASIMFRSNNATIIASLLAAYERDAKAKEKEAAEAEQPATNAKARAKAVKAAAAA